MDSGDRARGLWETTDMSNKPTPIVNNPDYEALRNRISALKTRLDLRTKVTKVKTKHAPEPLPMQDSTVSQTQMQQAPVAKAASKGVYMNQFDTALGALSRLEKKAFVPADQLAGGGDPNAGGMPPGMDPSMGGMPPGMDPSQMGGMPPVDPSQGGAMPPMDPSMGGGMPPGMDPNMMAAMMGGAPAGAPPAAPAPAPAAPAPSSDPSQRPATMADLSLIEERLKDLRNWLYERRL